jgi:hydroxyacylglutathione hydrolase
MTIHVKYLTLGPIATNAYLIGDTESGKAIVIDPVDDAPTLYDTVKQMGWTIQWILATHGHFDHVLASQPLKELTGAPFAIHELELDWLRSVPQRGVMFFGTPFAEAALPDRLLTSEPEVIEAGAIQLETLFTPGHSPGHISFYLPAQRTVFSGDALFQGSIGRTDLPGGDYDTLINSISEKLLPLGDDVRVLSGHGAPTTIGDERRTNPFLQP